MPPTDIYMDSDVTQLDINHYSAAMYFIKKADPDKTAVLVFLRVRGASEIVLWS